MTTRWTIPQLWTGQTVAILANGPGLTQELADDLRTVPCIAANGAAALAPWADMLVSLDGNWPDVEFAGLRVVGFESDAVNALYVNLLHDEVVLGPNHTIHIRNNALAAIRLAVQGGAAHLLLAGFDAERYEAIHSFPGFVQGLEQLVARVRGTGVTVEYVFADEAAGMDHAT